MLAALEWPLDDEEKSTAIETPPKSLPASLTKTLAALQQLRDLEPAADLGRQSRQDLTDLLAAVPGTRILQAIYLRDLMSLVPGPWAAPKKPTPQLAGLAPNDLALERADLQNALVHWTGHEFAGHSTVDLAELLLSSTDNLVPMAKGRVGWFLALLDLPAARTYLGLNEHQGRTYLRQEALVTYLQAMVVSGLLVDGSEEGKSASALLDAQALVLEAAQRAEYDVENLKVRLARG